MLCVIVVSLRLEELDYHLLTCLKCSSGSCEVVLATFSNVYVWEFFFLSLWWKVRFFFLLFWSCPPWRALSKISGLDYKFHHGASP